MNGVLFDTQILIWSLFDNLRLTPTIRERIDTTDVVLVSAVSLYEIDFKRRDPSRARAQDGSLLRMPSNMLQTLPLLGMSLIAVTPEDARLAATLPIPHRDPWDRILLAQAMNLGLPLITADRPLRDAAETHPDTRGVIVS